ncbi:MAG: formamidopyrimidine-DNA glycosylase [Sphingobacteriaceae bacterium]|nr:MAG: formamidopyrimidine-DNA glycosylase [Sphingobacteriaceae bacterium]
MPELPELEVFAANLENHFKNQILDRLEVTFSKKLNSYKQDLQQHLQGHRLHNVTRDGKTMLMHFRRGRSLALHLMLHGELKIITPGEKIENQIVALYFNSGKGFALCDPQKQAMVTLNPNPSTIPDVFSKDFTPQYLESKLENEPPDIKKLLTCQQIVRGIDNSYADEILWQAGISPFSAAQAIPKHKVQLLYKLIHERFKADIVKFEALANGGFTGNISAYHKIHNPDKTVSPSGGKILIDNSGPLKTCYTEEQELFK